MTRPELPAKSASRPWLAREIGATLALSGPIVLTNIAVNFMTTTDVMMLGWLSPKALAAGALGYNIYMPLFLFCIGVIGAVAPIAASLVGADPRDASGLRRACHQALLSAFVLAAPAWAILWNAEAILLAIGEPPDLAAQAGLYMHGLQWALAPALLYFATRSVFAALGRTAPTLIAGLIAVVFNAGANYALIFGHFGAPAWGVFGSGVATSLSQSVMLLMLVGHSLVDPHLRRYRLFVSLWRPDWPAFAKLWRLGLPIGATIAAEISIFAAAGLAMGLIGSVSLEAHAIVLQIASTAFMVPLGLGQAASVRVGHAFGARDPAGVARAGWVAFFVTMAYVALSAATMLRRAAAADRAVPGSQRKSKRRNRRAGALLPARGRDFPDVRRRAGRPRQHAARRPRFALADDDGASRLLGDRRAGRRRAGFFFAAARPRPVDRPRLRPRGGGAAIDVALARQGAARLFLKRNELIFAGVGTNA